MKPQHKANIAIQQKGLKMKMLIDKFLEPIICIQIIKAQQILVCSIFRFTITLVPYKLYSRQLNVSIFEGITFD